MKVETPELDKALKLEPQRLGMQILLDYLDERGFQICKFDSDREEYFPIYKSYSSIIADALKLDENKMEDEKRSILENLRNTNELEG